MYTLLKGAYPDPSAVIGQKLSAAAQSQVNELRVNSSQCQGSASGQAPIVRGVGKMFCCTQWLQGMRSPLFTIHSHGQSKCIGLIAVYK